MPTKLAKADRPPIPNGWTQIKGEDNLIYTFDEDGKPRCCAWRSKAKKYCTKHPITGRNRCEYHGGKSLRGLASPSYKGKGWTNDLPAQLAEKYRAAMSDDELLSLRSDIAMLEVSQGEVLSRVYDGDIGELWLEARDKYYELLGALRRNDELKSRDLMSELGDILNTGSSDYVAWNRFEKTSEQKRKLVDSERKRLVDMQQMITNEELMLVLGALVDSIRQHIPDKIVLAKISEDIRRLLGDKVTLKDS